MLLSYSQAPDHHLGPQETAKKSEIILFGILLAVSAALYNFIWMNKTYAMSESWAEVYCGLINRGYVPYRDFYYFLPPYSLFEDFILWKLSFGYMIVYRAWRLLQRILIIEIFYYLLSKNTRPFSAATVCFLSVVLASANTYDLGGDYNQTQQLWIVVVLVLMLLYVQPDRERKQKNLLAFCIGICGGLMFLSKQTLVFACFIVFFLFFLILILFRIEKKPLITFLLIAAGACIPLAIAFGYLVFHGATESFLYEVFLDTSSKGSLFDITVKSLLELIKGNLLYVIGLAALYLSLFLLRKRNCSAPGRIRTQYTVFCVLCIVTAVFCFLRANPGMLRSLVKLAWSYRKMSFLFAAALVVFLLMKPGSRLEILVFFCACGLIAAMLIVNPNGFTVSFIRGTSIFGFVNLIPTFFFIFLILWTLVHLFQCIAGKKTPDLPALCFAFAGLASGYSTSMATGVPSVSTISSFITVPASYFVLSKSFDLSTKHRPKIIGVITAVVFVVCMSQKLVVPYSWWGDEEAPYWEKTESVSIQTLKGFRFSKKERDKYEGLSSLIARYTDESSTIWGFPYVKVYNLLLDNYNPCGFVPVLFYDVCADDFAESDAEYVSLPSNEPDIVVWLDIPGCIETHESLFRGGEPLGQRKFIEWFSDAKETDYKLIGQVDNVFVYAHQRDFSRSHRYFIKDRTAENITAVYDDEGRSIPVPFEGTGVKEDPYLISSMEDLRAFRNLVNSGKTFVGEYLCQTADIDLSSLPNWTPIGKFGSENLFKGNYNGNGYKIIGMTINRPKENVGFFGKLAGTVENVNLVDCDITGHCIGGIASHGANSPTIVNCSVTGRLHGFLRAGGITDNFSGRVINCWADVSLEGSDDTDSMDSICSYLPSTIVKNCFSSDNTRPDTAEKMNRYLKKMKKEDFCQLLNLWEMDNSTLSVSHTPWDKLS